MHRIRKHSPIIALIVVLLVSYGFIALCGYYMKNPPEVRYYTPKDFAVPLPKYQFDFKQVQKVNRLPQFEEWFEIRSVMYDVPCSYNYIEYEYLGMYFITAYCPEECGGSWATSTGVICHYSERWSEPTTCAIDPKVRKYGEYLLVGHPDSADKKIYHAEDCGPGVQGQWIDCFVETMDEVRAWPTGYKPVYLVKYKTNTIYKKGWFYSYESFDRYLLLWGDSCRSLCGSGS